MKYPQIRSRVSSSLEPAQWLLEYLWQLGERVENIVPAVFAAYARVFHPPWTEGDGRFGTWAEVAESNARVVHAQMQWTNIAASPGRLPSTSWTDPYTGRIPDSLRLKLVDVLAPYTSTPGRIWMALWEGHGDLPEELSTSGKPVLVFPHRAYYLVEGDLGLVAGGWGQFANLWWPDDHAWLVATEVDLDSTYIGGSREAIEAILDTPGLEALPADPTDLITAASDRINVDTDSSSLVPRMRWWSRYRLGRRLRLTRQGPLSTQDP